MATLLAGGGRRSTAPSFDLTSQDGTDVLNYDSSLTDLLAGFDSPSAFADPPPQDAGFAVNQEFSGSPNQEWAGDLATGLKGASLGLNLYGQATGDQQFGEFGQNLGQAGAYTSALYGLANANDATGVAKAALPLALKQAAVPIPYAGMILGAANDGPRGAVAGTVTGALSVAFPALGIINAISGALGGPTIGSLISKFIGGGDKPAPTPAQLEEGMLRFFGGFDETASAGGSPEGFSGELFNPNSNP